MKFVVIPALLLLIIGASFGYLYLTFKQPELLAPFNKNDLVKVAENLWKPQEAKAFSNAPTLSATSAIFVEANTGQLLYEQNSHQRLHIASLTKIMTVIVALEHHDYSYYFTVSDHAANMEPDHMELRAGEKLKMEELLDGIFLVSANDAAEVLAEGTTGNRQEFTNDELGNRARRAEFIDLMNAKALEIGMNDTRFINPTGLEEDGVEQYSSAYDVLLMSRYAISHWPHLLDISSQPEIYLPESLSHQDYTLPSGINLLTTYPGVVGFKTGFTPEAGLTLVTAAKKDQQMVLGVLLGSTDRRNDARALLDYSFEQLGAKK